MYNLNLGNGKEGTLFLLEDENRKRLNLCGGMLKNRVVFLWTQLVSSLSLFPLCWIRVRLGDENPIGNRIGSRGILSDVFCELNHFDTDDICSEKRFYFSTVVILFSPSRNYISSRVIY
jgi:hypothetical protein